MRKRIMISPDTPIARFGGRPPQGVLYLLVVQVALFFIYAFANGPKWVNEHLALSAAGLLQRHELWQPLTALWIHLSTKDLLFNGLGLWLFGSPLERWWGRRRFIIFFIVTGVLGLLIGGLASALKPGQLLFGSSASIMACLVALALLFPRHLVFIYGLLPMQTRWFTLIIAGILLLGNLVGLMFLDVVVQIVGAASALLFFRPGPAPRIRVMDKSPSRAKLQVLDGGRPGQNKETKKYVN